MNDLTRRQIEECRNGMVGLQARPAPEPLAPGSAASERTSRLPRPLFVNCSVAGAAGDPGPPGRRRRGPARAL